jgi:hypothetical protein
MRLLLKGTLALALLVAGGASAQAPPPQPDYHPSLADLMTTAVQPRHTKIGLAGQARNWVYLDYEVNELKNAFARIGRTVPTFNGQALAPAIDARIGGQIERLAAAVKARDARRFDAAYADLTDACNACHKALNKDWIVIRAPSRAPTGQSYPDQVFGAGR